MTNQKVQEILNFLMENSIVVKLMDRIVNDDLIIQAIFGMGYLVSKLIVTFFIYKIGIRIVNRIIKTYENTRYFKELDESVKSFFHSFMMLFLKAILVIVCLVNLGVKGSSLLAFLGTMGVGIGLALKDSVANLAGGIIVLIFKTYKVGDFVEMSDLKGEVKAINVLTTQIITIDNKVITVPNGSIIANPLVNYTEKKVRRVDIVASISYDDDIEVARKALLEMVGTVDGVISHPAPQILVGEYADSSINLFVRTWVKTEDYWDVHFDIMSKIKPTLDANNLTIPYPQMDIHHHKTDKISLLADTEKMIKTA